VLSKLHDSIVLPLTNLFNKSLEEGVISDAWKEATGVALPA